MACFGHGLRPNACLVPEIVVFGHGLLSEVRLVPQKARFGHETSKNGIAKINLSLLTTFAIFVLCTYKRLGLGTIKASFVSALDFGYMCSRGETAFRK